MIAADFSALSHRFDAVEALLFSTSNDGNEYSHSPSSPFLQERVAKMTAFVDDAEKEVPSVKACRELSEYFNTLKRSYQKMNLIHETHLPPYISYSILLFVSSLLSFCFCFFFPSCRLVVRRL